MTEQPHRPHFGNDYNRTAHPKVLAALLATGDNTHLGYGLDEECAGAIVLIRTACAQPAAAVHFLVGGTQANVTVIDHLLRPWESVISPSSGHINEHETAAPEHAGHKVEALPHYHGKITAAQVAAHCEAYYASGITEHMPTPRMVYVSQPTEWGTVYTAEELRELRAACDRYGLLLFVDGARLGYALASPRCDVTLPLLAETADIFTIGGTKCGAAFGEAIVAKDPGLITHFRSSMKQNLGLLAKGWVLGAQFQALFTEGLYEKICSRANEYAQRIADTCRSSGLEMAFDSPTNQQFVILSPAQEAYLNECFIIQRLGVHERGAILRLCTSWATEEADVDALCAALEELAGI